MNSKSLVSISDLVHSILVLLRDPNLSSEDKYHLVQAHNELMKVSGMYEK